ncbi:MAG: hypothetical protein EOP35_05110 [Rubrivivax sp.]|nr:MAG: hypothetical protein EOP35_05110 [Rubrivivax sp.]
MQLNADAVYLDPITGAPRSKRYGSQWVFWPSPQYTGWRQPVSPDQVSILASGDLTSDYKVFFDHRGSLDAPEHIPSGSVKALDFDTAINGTTTRLMVSSVQRDGWYA